MLLHLSWVFDHDAEGNLIFKEDNLQKFKDYAALLTEKGVRNIMLTNAAYMYPYGCTRSHWKAVPEPGTELYIKFMQQIEDSYKMLAAAFPFTASRIVLLPTSNIPASSNSFGIFSPIAI